MSEKKKILVLDDEEIILKTTTKMLNHLGFDVDSSMSCSGIIEIYKDAKEKGSPFDAVIMDLTIPGDIGAVETLKKLKQIDPNVIGILSSGYTDGAIIERYKENGFKNIVLKPYGISELENVLNETLESL